MTTAALAPPARLDLDVAAPPYAYNPSSWAQRLPICALAGVAFVVATYGRRSR